MSDLCHLAGGGGGEDGAACVGGGESRAVQGGPGWDRLRCGILRISVRSLIDFTLEVKSHLLGVKLMLFMRPVVGGPLGLSPGVRVDLGAGCSVKGGSEFVSTC